MAPTAGKSVGRAETSPKGCKVLDVDQLSRNTFGDAALRREILGLFLGQLAATRQQLAQQPAGVPWGFMAHTLKGASAAVGAEALHALAEGWEKAGAPANPDDLTQRQAAFEAEVAAFQAASKALAA